MTCLANADHTRNLKKFSFEIPGRLPGMNEVIREARRNRFAGAGQKKKVESMICSVIMITRVPKFSVPVLIEFDWIEPDRRRDRGNIRVGEKFISDALVTMGRIPDDRQKFVKGFIDRFPDPDKSNPRVRVTISEAPDA